MDAAPARLHARLRALFLDHVLQADEGVDFDFLRGGPGQDWKPYEPTSH